MDKWSFNTLFADNVRDATDFSPAVAMHAGQAFVVYYDRTLQMLMCGTRGPAGAVVVTPITTNPKTSCAPALVDVNGTLHLLFADPDFKGMLCHMKYNDAAGDWIDKRWIPVTPPSAPALACIDGVLIMVCRSKDTQDCNVSRFSEKGGWTNLGSLMATGASSPSLVHAADSPCFVQLGPTEFQCIVPHANGSVVTLMPKTTIGTWTMLQPGTRTMQDVIATSCGATGVPSLSYAFVAYGWQDKTSRSLSVSQFNLNAWIPRQALGKTITLAPAVAVLGSLLFIVYVDPRTGRLWTAQRLVDVRVDAWMTPLDDATPLSALTIPGTHDTAACSVFMDTGYDRLPFTQTQNMTVPAQLALGIRFLDLRLKLQDGQLIMVHNIIPLGSTFAQILTAIQQFLASNKNEVVLVSIKDDTDGGDKAADLRAAFDNAVRLLINASGLFYTGDNIPILGAVRGHIVLIRRFITDPTRLPYGLDLSGTNWPDDTKMALVPSNNALQNNGVQQFVALQDNFNYKSWLSIQPILDAKWAVVKAFLSSTLATPVTTPQLCINFLSAAGSSGPYTIATGRYHNPEEAKDVAIVGMNTRLYQYLLASPPTNRLGIIVLDYPEVPADLLPTLIRLNKPKKN